MTTRDRLMLMGIAALAVLGAIWLMAVTPEREHAAKVSAEVESARQQLVTAESQAREARSAQSHYSTAYTSLVTLGQAVPASAETPALIYTLQAASNSHDVDFSSITDGSSSSSSSSSAASSPASTSSSATSAAAQGAGLSQQPFTFVFSGNFIALSKLLGGLESFTVLTSSGPLQVSGRLLTINSVSLAPDATTTQNVSKTGGSNKTEAPDLTGTVTATAYVLPAGEAALGGATASGPAGAQSPASAPSTASGGSGGAPTAAVVKANP